MPSNWHMCKDGKAGKKKKGQRRGLLVFSQLLSFTSAGSRSGCFDTSLGCKYSCRFPMAENGDFRQLESPSS
jgi:hypothetical protein